MNKTDSVALFAPLFPINSRGWTAKAIASYLKCASSTVRQAIHRWEAQGRGRKVTWKNEDWQAILTWLSEERSYSARQLSQKLVAERQVRLGAEQVRRILLKKNGAGKG